MTKKEYVMRALYALKDYWKLAPWLIKMMEDNEINDEGVEWLYEIISTTIKEVNDDELREKLTASMRYLEKIQANEEEYNKRQQDELDELEKAIFDA
mgnify:CR=1 FL=1